MRLYLSKRESQSVLEALENSPCKNQPEVADVIERLKQCEVLQTHSKRKSKNPPDEAGR